MGASGIGISPEGEYILTRPASDLIGYTDWKLSIIQTLLSYDSTSRAKYLPSEGGVGL